MVKNLVGPPVTGDNFVGRRNEIERAVSVLEQGNSLLLASPRRVGKSSFSQKMLEVFKQKGYLPVYLDLQGMKSEQEFGDRLADKLEEPGLVYAEVRQMLENDGYLMEAEEGNIVFRSPIIRQYWFNKFVK